MLEDDEHSDPPEGAGDDSVQPTGLVHTAIAATPEGQLLERFIEAANSAGERAEEQYKETLEDVLKHSDAILVEIARALGHCSEGDYPFRWALVHTATELRDDGALALLASVVKTPIPAEKSPTPHSFSSVLEETVIRTTAVDGIGQLASRGNEGAVEMLFSFLSLPSFSIRRAAVTGLMSAPRGEELLDRIAACLPEEERFLLELRKADVREIEQIADPTRHLSEVGKAEGTEVPPEFARTVADIEKGASPRSKKPKQAKQEPDDK